MAHRRSQDPFAPIEVAVSALLALLGVGLAMFAVLLAVQLLVQGHSSVSFATVGDSETCVLADGGGHSVPVYTADGDGFRPAEGIEGLRQSAASARTENWTICLKRASAWQWTAARIEPVSEVGFLVTSLLMIRRTIRGARRTGLFTDDAARRTRQLGWFILLYAVITPVLAAAGRGVVISAAVRDVSWSRELGNPHISVLLVVVSLGILTFARILRLAVPLQEEVDATV
jgi:hypothetical protein